MYTGNAKSLAHHEPDPVPAPLELGAVGPWRNLGVIRRKQLYNHSLLISNLLLSQMETLCVCGNLVRVSSSLIVFSQDSAVRHGTLSQTKSRPLCTLVEYLCLFPITSWYPRPSRSSLEVVRWLPHFTLWSWEYSYIQEKGVYTKCLGILINKVTR